jgi:hypothetical protein
MRIPNFYSVNEVRQPPDQRRHHNNDRCGAGKEIPQLDRRGGTCGYSLCEDCRKLTQ